ncbi:cathepsin O isoform X2 [Fundulus heteroclitus]|uniref:cathepsin O isoform X2 n=1 Tax=Fundulus heteroclitus TaxID=8078 RepID=UPI00165BAC05|nr:cathepsin O isoform X2 [Fundulus heteroclitus]
MGAFRAFSVLLVAFASFGESLASLNGSTTDFDSFRKKFHRSYEVNSEEFSRRQIYFQKAAVRHLHLNSFSTESQSATYGINQFADLSQMEFRDVYLRAESSSRAPGFAGLTRTGLPARFDWRDKGVVAPVQNQLACGSCWAFSTVGAVQSVRAMGGLQLEQLSVQQVLDCSWENQGCNGGSPSRALAWLKQTRVKLVRASEYPYKAETGACHFFSQSHEGVAVKNFTLYSFRGHSLLDCAELLGNDMGGSGLRVCKDRRQHLRYRRFCGSCFSLTTVCMSHCVWVLPFAKMK